MTNQSRTLRVLISLVAAMTVGAVVLMTLDRQSLPRGPFSLAIYTNLNSIEQVALSPITLSKQNWNRIEVYYSKTAGDTEQVLEFDALRKGDANFHFFVCDGRIGSEGMIQPTKRWNRQQPCQSGGNWYGDSKTIRICVIADGLRNKPTDCQVSRTNELVEALSRKIGISTEQLSYPLDWQL